MSNLIGMFIFVAVAYSAGAMIWCAVLAGFIGKEKLFSGIRSAALTYLGGSFAGWGFTVASIWVVIHLQDFLH